MYWIDEEFGTLQHLTDAGVENVDVNFQNATNFTVNTTDNKIYWTEKIGKARGKILRANLDGSEIEELKSLLSTPFSIAINSEGSKLYWTTYAGTTARGFHRGTIQRSNFQGKLVKTLIRNLNTPRGITLDVSGNKLYWTQPDSIWRANLNGKNAEELVTGLKDVGDIDITDSHIYWTEEADVNLGAVKRANLDGTNPEEIILVRNVALKGIAVDHVGKKLYWTDTRGRIRRANLNGLRIQNVVTGLGTPAYLALNVSAPETPAAPRSTSDAHFQNQAAITPQETDLLANYPNPFNPETWIPYQLATNTDVRIFIYDARGTIVRRLELGHQPAGYYTGQNRAAYWDGRNSLGEPVASGIYFYQLRTDEVSLMRKMVILK
jgi:sugar lactone lactonase YvrE